MVAHTRHRTRGRHPQNSEVELAKIRRLLDANRPEEALKLAGHYEGADDRFKNAKGVCLMRLGRFNEAIRVFRNLALTHGVLLRQEAPLLYKTNLATSLLLSGQVDGCRSILGEINDKQDVTVRRLREAIKRQNTQMTLWQRFGCWLGTRDPGPVTLDFPPGDV